MTNGQIRGGRTVLEVRAQLREAIIKGELPPGTPLTTVRLAERFGVSRTPMREALRMLQEEGFVRFESNQRPVVVEWSAEELETVFAQRILLTALCTRLTVPRLTDADLAHLGDLLVTLQVADTAKDLDAWRGADVEFHQQHMMHASDVLRADLNRLYERSLMFRVMWLGDHGTSSSFSLHDHPEIFEACQRRDPYAASHAAARHLARVALTLLSQLAPDREPLIVRDALRFASLDSIAVP